MDKLTAELILNEKKRERIHLMENLKKRIMNSDLTGMDKLYLEKLLESETEDYEETHKYGVWLWYRGSDYHCSQCSKCVTCTEYADDDGEFHSEFNFCPYCGAEMED